ncbi:MAG: hypothetical protein MJZ13_05315 [Bacteroidales bacterium]|nr:hypothetical protein [Bacteroidales bacterium]
MINKLIAVASLLLASLVTSAQAPEQNNFTVAVTVGYNSFASVEAQAGTSSAYSAVAPNTNWSNKKLMTGFELGWFAAPNIKVSLGGGVNYTKNPGYSEIPGTSSGLPTYYAVNESMTFCYDAHLAGDYYFNTRVENLKLYTGLRGGFAYCVDEKTYDNSEYYGKSQAEAYTIKGSIDFGADYFIAKGFYVGAQVDFGSFTYGLVNYKPQAGLPNLQADNFGFSFLSAPTLKIGFAF